MVGNIVERRLTPGEAAAEAGTIVELRRRRLTQAGIAQVINVSKSTVSRVLARAGLSKRYRAGFRGRSIAQTPFSETDSHN